MIRRTSVVVIGAGQAGLSAAYHLQRRGFASEFVVLDADAQPGGAWQHRWASLRMDTVNGIFDLPGMPRPEVDQHESSSSAIPRYFAAYERAFDLPILRPVRVRRVDDTPGGELLVDTDHGQWLTRALINATGTWTNPVRPQYPGSALFQGRQLHTHDYVDAAEFAGQRVAIVGGGISAVQLLEEISRVATTFWYTRREPVFIDEFRPEHEGRATIAKVIADVEAGRPSSSVVSYTGLGWTDYARAAHERGALVRRPMFTEMTTSGVRETDGTRIELDAVLWATGFRAALAHLEPLHLRGPLGGIPMSGTQVAADPRIHLIGYGPSQSTVGANRAGRAAVAALRRTITPESIHVPDTIGYRTPRPHAPA
ncbi:NAD(P)/FAD-dependent oxidoreductase [Actinoplanes sp. NBC_00393]|uniref:FAD-dependent oxidoreductase n=1 Tax=Actinoplanes sp. NBC_00393 TaxID=2975953 RepID=UPI002E1E3B6C